MLKREINIQELECVFCGYKEVYKVGEGIIKDETPFIYDKLHHWKCKNCGEENDIDPLLSGEKSQKLLELVEKEKWNQLLKIYPEDEYFGMIFIQLAKHLFQEKKVDQAEKIAKIILHYCKNDWAAEVMIERIQKARKQNKK